MTINFLCLFCYKSTTSASKTREDNYSVKQFLKLLGRFVKHGDWENNLELTNSLEDCCEDCGYLIEGFCKMYHQIKCLELELLLKLENLGNVMKLADKVPSRVKNVQTLLEMKTEQNFFEDSQNSHVCKEKWRKIRSSRKTIINNCFLGQKLDALQPRILLDRIDGNSKSLENSKSIDDQSTLIENFNASQSSISYEKACHNWLLSFAVLVYLLSISSTFEGSKKPLENLELIHLDDDDNSKENLNETVILRSNSNADEYSLGWYENEDDEEDVMNEDNERENKLEDEQMIEFEGTGDLKNYDPLREGGYPHHNDHTYCKIFDSGSIHGKSRKVGGRRTTKMLESKSEGNNYIIEQINEGEEDEKRMLNAKISVEKRYTCLKCGRKYAYLSSLTRHKQVHKSVEKRYTCLKCGRKYAYLSSLTRHKQVHKSLDCEDAKKCKFCGKVYVSNAAFSMHLKSHTLNHKCGLCGRGFARQWLLKGHMRSHTGEKPYECAHCGKAYADRSSLLGHMRKH